MTRTTDPTPARPRSLRTELACARALLDELESLIASGSANAPLADLAQQLAEELVRVAGRLTRSMAGMSDDVARGQTSR